MYLQPAEPGVPLYIAGIEELLQMAPEAEAAAADPTQGMYATVRWFYRPQELELDAPLPVYANEVFAADERAIHPLNSVCGTCQVVPPGHPSVRTGTLGVPITPPDVFVCNKKYISSEG